MNALDLVFLVLLAALMLVGIFKGMARILIGIGALVAAFVLAAQFHGALAPRLDWLDVPLGAQRMLAYSAIFLSTMLVGGIVAFVVRKWLVAAMLGWADRLGGAAVGFVAAALISGLLVLPLVAYSRSGSAALRESRIAPYVAVIADLAHRWVPDELSQSYQHKIESLRGYWSGRSESETVQRRD